MNVKLLQAFHEQINKEYYSAFLYLSMSNWLNEKGLPGAANWNYVQYQEELAHAENLFRYLQYRDESVALMPIDKPDDSWDSVLDLFKHVLAHEKIVTASINSLTTTAMQANDHAATIFLQWYVSEQVEEEATASDLIQKYTMAGDDPNGLLMLDAQLAARTFVAPTVPGVG